MTDQLKSFADALTAASYATIDAKMPPRSLQIPIDYVIPYYQKWNPPDDGNNSSFLRRIKYIAKKNMYIDIKTDRKKNSRSNFVILHSDRSLRESDMFPLVIQDSKDRNIQFMSDMIPPPILQPTRVTPSKEPSEDPNPSVTQARTEYNITAYPLLDSLGISTHFDSNKDQLINLVSELVHLFKSNKQPINFIHRGNDRPGLLVAIPKAKTYSTFEKMQRTENWLDQIMEFFNNNNTTDDNFYWILCHIYKKAPHVLVKFSSNIGLIICNKMTAVEAAAMWVEANIPIRASRIILRHLHVKFGNRLQVPFDQIAILSNITTQIQPKFEEFMYQKDGSEDKVAEKIKFWTIPPKNLLELDFSRLLMSDKSKSTFGYASKVFLPNELGVVVIIGSDHGGGRSRYLIRTNYLPSSHRRTTNKVCAGTRTLQFAEVICKKDVVQIQAKIAPLVNETIRTLENSKLVAMQLKGHVICKFLPHNAENITASIVDSNTINLDYTLPASQTTLTTVIHPHHHIDIQPNF